MTTDDGCADDTAHPFLFDLPASAVLPGASAGRSAGSVVTDPTLAPDGRAEEFFWRHVIRTPDCWYWVGAISSPDGYGRITFQRTHRQRSVSAHRFALMLTHSADPGDLEWVGEHVCNEPLCVRVDAAHVRAGTQASNISYAVALGRHHGPRPTTSWTRIDRSRAVRDYLLAGGAPDGVREQFDRPTDDHQFRLF